MVYADDKYPRLMPTRPHATDNLKEDKEDTRGERERERERREKERENPKPYWGDGFRRRRMERNFGGVFKGAQEQEEGRRERAKTATGSK